MSVEVTMARSTPETRKVMLVLFLLVVLYRPRSFEKKECELQKERSASEVLSETTAEVPPRDEMANDLQGEPVTVGYTHFLSLPLGTIPSVAAKVGPFLDELKQTLRASAASSGGGATDAERDAYVDALVQKVPKLHFTILMLSLPTPARLAEAVALMPRVEQLVRDAFPNPSDTPLVLRGLDVMEATSPNASRVLYIPLDPNATSTKTFSQLVFDIGQLFLDAELASAESVERAKKIHCTVANVEKAIRAASAGDATRSPPARVFDATLALKKFGNKPFGSHVPDTLELSVLGKLVNEGSNNVQSAENGYGYASDAAVRFPKQNKLIEANHMGSDVWYKGFNNNMFCWM